MVGLRRAIPANVILRTDSDISNAITSRLVGVKVRKAASCTRLASAVVSVGPTTAESSNRY